MAGSVSRRRFLGGGAAAVLTTVGGVTLASGCSDDASSGANAASATDTAVKRSVIPFEGLHQAGIVTPAPDHSIIAAFTTVAVDATQLRTMFQTLTVEVRDLMSGKTVAAVDPLLPPSDNLLVGVVPPADDLTITVAVGASLFDGRYGLTPLTPHELVEMPKFPNDKPDIDQMHGDLVIQICAGTPEMCNHALRRLMRATRDSLVVKWMMSGFVQPNTLGAGRSSTRNMLGFKDGTANPHAGDAVLMDDLVWIGAGTTEPAWTVGGSYLAIRLIRNRVEFWDRTPLRTQETIIGRIKDSGAPLDGVNETDIPDFASDPAGARMRLDGHIRLANPRTPATEKNRILRRGYNYSAGFDRSGQLDQGLIFVCYQKSLNDGFVAVQTRLDGEALEEYITPFGGGYFFVLPGVTDADGFLAEKLFT